MQVSDDESAISAQNGQSGAGTPIGRGTKIFLHSCLCEKPSGRLEKGVAGLMIPHLLYLFKTVIVPCPSTHQTIEMFVLKFSCFCLAVLAASGCNKNSQQQPPPKPLVLVSIAPYRLMTERIAGPDFTVETIVPEVTNPHSFEPTAMQVTRIGQSQVWFCMGEPFEKKILPILQTRNAGLVVADLRDGIEMIADSSGCPSCSIDHLDRHIWLSPKLAKKQARIITNTLMKTYPDHGADFQKNLSILSNELDDLDQEIREILKGAKKRAMLVSHPAFSYFCKDFDLLQLSIEYEGKDPRPKHLEEVLRAAISNSAEIALALPQYNNKGAQLLAKKLHKPVRWIDPYSANYFEMMRKLAHLIADPYAN